MALAGAEEAARPRHPRPEQTPPALTGAHSATSARLFFPFPFLFSQQITHSVSHSPPPHRPQLPTPSQCTKRLESSCTPLYQRGVWGTERQSDSPNVTQQVCEGSRSKASGLCPFARETPSQGEGVGAGPPPCFIQPQETPPPWLQHLFSQPPLPASGVCTSCRGAPGKLKLSSPKPRPTGCLCSHSSICSKK